MVNPKFKVGDEVMFTNKCGNKDFHGFIGVVSRIEGGNLKLIEVTCKHYPTNKDIQPYISKLSWKDCKLIRKLTKLEKALK